MAFDFTGLALAITAGCSGASLVMTTINGILSSRRQTKNAEAIAHVTSKVETVVADVAQVKVDTKELATNTNSMKDALVKVTGEAEFAKGEKAQKARTDAKKE